MSGIRWESRGCIRGRRDRRAARLRHAGARRTAALADGHLAAAGLDVFAQEPAERTNPLFTLPNVVVSPHIAWLTRETFERSLGVAVENCRRLAAGEELLNRVA